MGRYRWRCRHHQQKTVSVSSRSSSTNTTYLRIASAPRAAVVGDGSADVLNVIVRDAGRERGASAGGDDRRGNCILALVVLAEPEGDLSRHGRSDRSDGEGDGLHIGWQEVVFGLLSEIGWIWQLTGTDAACLYMPCCLQEDEGPRSRLAERRRGVRPVLRRWKRTVGPLLPAHQTTSSIQPPSRTACSLR